MPNTNNDTRSTFREMPDLAAMGFADWRNDKRMLAGPGRPNERMAMVKRHRHNVYSLTMVPDIGRNRWGTEAQIRSDCEHFLTYGSLPGPDGPRW